MKFINRIATLSAMALTVLANASVASATTNQRSESATQYVAAFAPIFGTSTFPRSGTMSLQISDGSIRGSYTGTSVGPDSLDNRIVLVSGSVSPSDGYVQLLIGQNITLRGTLAADGTISGTATEGGQFYEFIAAPQRSR